MTGKNIFATSQKTSILVLLLGIAIGALFMFLLRGSNKKDEPRVEVSHNMIIETITDIGNLEVVKYNLQDIVEYKKIRQWLPNAKTMLVISGEVTGCIDLSLLSEKDIYVSGDSLRLMLPAPQVCHVSIDHKNSRIYNMEYGLWETAKIVDEAYRHAEIKLREQAYRLDIESKSRENATNLLTPILQAMGFKHILVSFKSDKMQPKG
ncbi:DUF4230 domain-containing protein [Dysgonomonas sp. 511]|uniref:DUF4230 domain-containing protein n=1 Tax=Dysgonomonas sp. 511 TaxID=2302930 RepID=UPI0013D71597|nr:DUF4230 domain-containing protein [Dysgonomonas sp. 511]NDV78319.1 DUF4230 domain-containing protein [Dysgonomonas sp. 511]